MKRPFIISLTIIACLASCSKTDVAYEPTGEIQIVPVNENVTKSVMSTNDFQGAEFKVWSWFNPSGEGTDISTFQSGMSDGSTTQYIDEKDFIEKTVENKTNVWGGRVSYFWPKTGSLVFAGYHAPKLTDGTADTIDQVTYTFTESENCMTFKEVSQVQVTGDEKFEEDIMYFNMTPTSYNAKSGTVSIKFNHALTWMSVTLSKKSHPEINAKIIVHDVWFTDVCSKGTGTVSGQNTIEWDEDESSKQSHYVLKNADVELQYNKTGENIESIKVKLVEYLLIPQAISGKLNVTYTVISEDSDNSKFTETYEVDLKERVSQTEWLAGKHYTYDITIGTDELLVSPGINDWGEEKEEIKIPIPEVTPGNPGIPGTN